MLNLSLLAKRRTDTLLGESVRTLGIRKPCLQWTHFCPAYLQGLSPHLLKQSSSGRVTGWSCPCPRPPGTRPASGLARRAPPGPVAGLGIGSDSGWGQPQSSWGMSHSCWKTRPFPMGSFELTGVSFTVISITVRRRPA